MNILPAAAAFSGPLVAGALGANAANPMPSSAGAGAAAGVAVAAALNLIPGLKDLGQRSPAMFAAIVGVGVAAGMAAIRTDDIPLEPRSNMYLPPPGAAPMHGLV